MQVSRTGWALTAMSLLACAALAPDVPHLVADLSGPSFPDAALALASLILLALAGWSLLVIGLVVVGGSSALVAAITPALLRRAVLAGAAGTLVAAPAHAEHRAAPDAPARHSVAGLPLPDRPEADSAAPALAPASAPGPVPTAQTTPASVVVRAGDTLWAIAARTLPPDASPHDIARATARWYDANRELIGDDPDLIVPRQRLEPPTAKDHP